MCYLIYIQLLLRETKTRNTNRTGGFFFCFYKKKTVRRRRTICFLSPQRNATKIKFFVNHMVSPRSITAFQPHTERQVYTYDNRYETKSFTTNPPTYPDDQCDYYVNIVFFFRFSLSLFLSACLLRRGRRRTVPTLHAGIRVQLLTSKHRLRATLRGLHECCPGRPRHQDSIRI